MTQMILGFKGERVGLGHLLCASFARKCFLKTCKSWNCKKWNRLHYWKGKGIKVQKPSFSGRFSATPDTFLNFVFLLHNWVYDFFSNCYWSMVGNVLLVSDEQHSNLTHLYNTQCSSHKCSHHLSTYIITTLRTIFPRLYFSHLWLILILKVWSLLGLLPKIKCNTESLNS